MNTLGKKRFGLVGVLVVWCVTAWMTERSCAQDPADILDHYRIVPRLSRLHQTGGIAGVHQRYLLTGGYDFRHSSGFPSMASFEDAEVWGSLISDFPTPAVVTDVDELLNLEGLKGTQLPVAAPFDVYRFRGEIADGSSIELHAAVLGRWMYLRGSTQPPPGGADFFEYRLNAVARSGAFADFNDDGVVDAADYVLLRDTDGAVRHISGVSMGASFTEWREQYGEAIPDMTAVDMAMSAALASFVADAAIPEPASLSLVLLGPLWIASIRRRRD